MSDQNPTQAHPAIEQYARHVNPTFIKLLGMFGYGRVYTKAQDVWLWDHQERKYIDFLAGFGAVNVGHNHPRLLQTLQRFVQEQTINFCHIGPPVAAASLAAKLAEITPDPLSISMFASSGSEAVEAGMKIARAYTKRSGFLYCDGGFHGTNLGTLSIMGSERMRKPFEPLLDHCHNVPFGDLNALEAALSKKDIAGFILEPIQAESGVILPPSGYLKAAQDLCKKYKTLLILDEVQTGLGRTGQMFAYEDQGFVPDILLLAKSLSGGLVPISVAITSEKIFKKAYGSTDRFDLHSSTFEGNQLSCMIAEETIKIIEEEKLAQNSKERGEQLLKGLREKLSGHPFIRDIRGKGLLAAIELGPTDKGFLNKLSPKLVTAISKNIFGQWAALRLLEEGMICQAAAHEWNILKLEPPLTITEEQVDLGIQKIVDVFERYPTLTVLLKDAMGRLGSQMTKGWKFD